MRAPLQRSSRSNPASSSAAKRGSTPSKKRKVPVEAGNGGGAKKKPPSGLAAAKLVTKKVKVVGAETKKLLPATGKAKVLVVVKKVGTKKTTAQKKATKPAKKLLKKSKPQIGKKTDHGDTVSGPGTSLCESPGPRKATAQQQVTKAANSTRIVVGSTTTTSTSAPAARKTLVRKAHKIVAPVVKTKLKKTLLVEKVIVSPKKTKTALIKKKVIKKMPSEAAQAGPSASNSGSGSNSPTTSAEPDAPLQDSSIGSPTGSPSSCRSTANSTVESSSSKKTKESETSTSSCKKSKETDKKESIGGTTKKSDSATTTGCKSPKGAENPASVGCKKIKDTEATVKKQKEPEASGNASCKKQKDIETQCTTNAKKVKDLENSKKLKETEHTNADKTKDTKIIANINKKTKDTDAPLSGGKKKTKEIETTSTVSKKAKDTETFPCVLNKKTKEGEICAKVMANASTNTSVVTKKKLLPNKTKPKVESKDVGTLVKPDQNVSDQAVVTATIVTIVGEGPETVDRGDVPKILEKTDSKYYSSNSSSGKRSDDEKLKTKKPKIKKKMLLIASDPKNAANVGATLKKLSTKIISSKLKKGISKKSDSADEMKKKIIAKMVAKKAASILGVDFDESIKADIKIEDDIDKIEYLESADPTLVTEETTPTDEDRKPVIMPSGESGKTASPSGDVSLASSQPSADDDSSTSDEITLDLLLLRQQEWKRAQQARALEDGFGSDSGTEGKLANIKVEPAVTAASDEDNLKPLKVRIREKLAATVAKAAVAAVANLPSSNSSGTESPSRGKLSKKMATVKIEPKDEVKTEIKRESSDDEASSSSGKPQQRVKKKRRAIKTKGKKILTADNSGSDTEQRARRMKLFGFWSGPKRHRVASLNALAKVHCLYENESRGALLGLCGPNTKVAVAAKKPATPTSVTRKTAAGKTAVPASTRTLRSVPGLREPGRNWDMQNASSTTSSSPPTSSSEDNSEEAHKQPLQKKRMLKKKTSASSDASKNSVGSPQPKKVVRRKRNRAELTMDLKDMVVRKRMASLNASAILAASYSAEKRHPKPTAFDEDDRHPRKRHKKPGSGSKPRRKGSSRDETTSEDDSDSSASQQPTPPPQAPQQPPHSPQQPPALDVVGGGGVIELRTTSSTTSPSKKVAMIQLNQDTDVTITGVYVNSTTRSTRHEGFCSIAGMQYRISSTSHTQTEATAVATETVQLHAAPEHPPPEAVPSPLKSYTPLGALSSMQPPGHHPQHRVVSPLGAGVRRVQAPPPPQGPVPPPPPPPHGCGASAFSAPPPPTYGPPQPPPDPAYIHGYYQPAGPLITAAAASHHLAPPPHVGGGSKAQQQQHAALPPTPTPPPTSQTGQSSAPSTRDESSDNDVTIIATGTSSEVMPQYRYPSQQPQQYGYGYPHTPQYYPSPPASSLQYPPHYHSHQDLCYPPPPYFHHKTYSTPPPPPPPAAARYHQRYLPQYYEAPPPPPPQQQSGTSTQQMVSTSSSGSGGTGYQAVGPPAPTSSDSYGPPPPPIVEPYPPPPGYYGYGAAPGTPACYSHSPPTRSLAYIDAAYQSCPCPMQSCPKNVHTGPLTGDGKGPPPNSTSKASSLPPIALALPLEIPGGALGPPSPARGSAGMPPPPSPATAWGPDQQQQALMATASATQLMCSEDGRVSNDHVHKSNFSVNDVSSEKCSEEISSRHQQEGQTNITLVDPKLETSPLVKQESRITIISEETVKPSEMRNDKPSSPLSRKRRLSSGGGKVEITEPVVAKKPRDENVTPAAQPSTPKVLEAVQQEKSFPEQESSKQLPVKEEHLSKINGVQQGAKQSLKKKKCKAEKIKQTIVKKRQTQPKIYPSRAKLLCINNNKVTGPQAIDNILHENRACQKQLKEKLNKTSTPRSVGRPKSKQQVKTEVAKKKIVNRRLSTSKQNTMESAGKKVSNSNSALVLHRKMTIPKRLTNTPKWSNGWSWEGTPFEAKVFLTSDDVPVMRTCYPAMRHIEGDLVCPHDSVLLKSGPRKLDLPFVAKVAALWENPDDGEMMVSLLWYYRPEHTEQGCIAADAEDEIFASKHKDINSVACIEDKCYVLTFNEYCRYRKAARRQDEGVPEPPRVVPLPEDNPRRHFQPPGCVSSDLVFYCRRVYDFRQKRIVSSRVQGCRYGRTLGRHRARRLL